MADIVTLERTMPASATRVFEMITQPENMVRWWGYDTMKVSEHNLDFSRPGPWHTVLQSADGTRRKVSGVVSEVEPPRYIAFTWAWHDGGPEGARGAETRVTIEINEVDENSAQMILRHHDLGTDSARASHTKGWLSLIDKLEKGLA
jgi:uncharacterized protein YndB with AHSA1/START domain